MKPEEFSAFQHNAVHELMALNERCEEEFHISSWPRWHYDLERETLTFSENGVPKVLASIQVVGTTSVSGGTWLWGWANENLPPNAKKEVAKVREFGLAGEIRELTEAELPDDEYLGWAMTAVAAKLLGAKGAYRCPGKNGFVYVVYSSVKFAASEAGTESQLEQMECADHERGFSTYVCEHLVVNPGQEWFSQEPDEEHKWPDAWCAACDAFFQQQGEWNEKNESRIKIELICHHCYERLRSQQVE
jgi:hypothetical protein